MRDQPMNELGHDDRGELPLTGKRRDKEGGVGIMTMKGLGRAREARGASRVCLGKSEDFSPKRAGVAGCDPYGFHGRRVRQARQIRA